MKKIFTDGEVDFSDEGSQSKAIVSEAEVNHFYSTLSKRQQIVLTYLLSKEEQKDIARFLGSTEMEVSRDIKQIRESIKTKLPEVYRDMLKRIRKQKDGSF